MVQQPLSKAFLRQQWRSTQLSRFCHNPNQSRSISSTIPHFAESNIPATGPPASVMRRRRPPTLDSSRAGPLDPAALLKKHGFPGLSRSQPAPERTIGEPREEYRVDSRVQAMMARAKADVAANSVEDQNHHFHVYSHRHNCHITLTGPDRNPLLSVSAGNLGFRHTQRGTYDAAYQLAVYTLTKMVEKGFIHNMQGVELVLRGYGAGREAVVKAIVGSEGRRLKPLIVRVTDSTRLKFGGTKSKNVRRL